MTLAEELRALAEEGRYFTRYKSSHGTCCNCVTCGYDKDRCMCRWIEDVEALAARAEQEQSPEREAFVEAASAMAAELVTWGAVSGPPGTREFLSAYRAMLAAEEKRKEGV